MIFGLGIALVVVGYFVGRRHGHAVGHAAGWEEGYAQARDDWSPR